MRAGGAPLGERGYRHRIAYHQVGGVEMGVPSHAVGTSAWAPSYRKRMDVQLAWMFPLKLLKLLLLLTVCVVLLNGCQRWSCRCR